MALRQANGYSRCDWIIRIRRFDGGATIHGHWMPCPGLHTFGEFDGYDPGNRKPELLKLVSQSLVGGTTQRAFF